MKRNTHNEVFSQSLKEIHELTNLQKQSMKATGELKDLENKFQLKLEADPNCGETVTSMSTCTRITTSTDPCNRTNPTFKPDVEMETLIDTEEALSFIKNKI